MGIGEGVTPIIALRREVIHRLYISPLSHSEVVKHFRVSWWLGSLSVVCVCYHECVS